MDTIEVTGLRKEYGTLVAVKDVDFQTEQGQVVGLIGPNGAGKTTLLRMLATLLRPTRGSVRILSFDVEKDYLQIRKHIGYLPDFFNLYNDLTLEECLHFFARSYGVDPNAIEQKIDTVLSDVNLEEKRYDLNRNLSRGMVQRMGLATLLVRDPDIFLLDEPASGLDPKARIELRQILIDLSQQGKTVIISSHILTELSGFCSHIAIMHNGKIVRQGSVDEIQADFSDTKTVTISVIDQAAQAAELIRSANLPVTVTDVSDSSITTTVNGGNDEIAAINSLLVQNNIHVFSLTEQKMDLEDLFMKISEDHHEDTSK